MFVGLVNPRVLIITAVFVILLVFVIVIARARYMS